MIVTGTEGTREEIATGVLEPWRRDFPVDVWFQGDVATHSSEARRITRVKYPDFSLSVPTVCIPDIASHWPNQATHLSQRARN